MKSRPVPTIKVVGLTTAFTLLILFFVLAGCSFEYEKSRNTAETIVPDYILKNTEYIIERTGEHAMIFEAERLLMFSDRHSAELKDVSFRERDGDSVPYGSCDEAVIDTNSRDAELSGSIVIVSPAEGITLRADLLIWSNAGKKLVTGKEDEVIITYDDGSTVRGVGFEGDFNLRIFTFESIIEGSMQYE